MTSRSLQAVACFVLMLMVPWLGAVGSSDTSGAPTLTDASARRLAGDLSDDLLIDAWQWGPRWRHWPEFGSVELLTSSMSGDDAVVTWTAAGPLAISPSTGDIDLIIDHDAPTASDPRRLPHLVLDQVLDLSRYDVIGARLDAANASVDLDDPPDDASAVWLDVCQAGIIPWQDADGEPCPRTAAWPPRNASPVVSYPRALRLGMEWNPSAPSVGLQLTLVLQNRTDLSEHTIELALVLVKEVALQPGSMRIEGVTRTRLEAVDATEVDAHHWTPTTFERSLTGLVALDIDLDLEIPRPATFEFNATPLGRWRHPDLASGAWFPICSSARQAIIELGDLNRSLVEVDDAAGPLTLEIADLRELPSIGCGPQLLGITPDASRLARPVPWRYSWDDVRPADATALRARFRLTTAVHVWLEEPSLAPNGSTCTGTDPAGLARSCTEWIESGTYVDELDLIWRDASGRTLSYHSIEVPEFDRYGSDDFPAAVLEPYPEGWRLTAVGAGRGPLPVIHSDRNSGLIEPLWLEEGESVIVGAGCTPARLSTGAWVTAHRWPAEPVGVEQDALLLEWMVPDETWTYLLDPDPAIWGSGLESDRMLLGLGPNGSEVRIILDRSARSEAIECEDEGLRELVTSAARDLATGEQSGAPGSIAAGLGCLLVTIIVVQLAALLIGPPRPEEPVSVHVPATQPPGVPDPWVLSGGAVINRERRLEPPD